MTVAEYIFEFLENKGCKTVFMVSGSSSMWLTDALKRNDSLEAICCHHEQAAAMAADGYGRVNGAPGACLVTIGPGAMNAITGVAQAYLDSSPMLILSGQASSKLLEYGAQTKIRQKGTQSINLEPIVTSITKYFAAVMKPDDICYHMEKAYFEATEGRKGPVWLDIPVDVQNQQISQGMQDYCYKDIYEKKLNTSYEEIEELILKAEKPLILGGYGIRSAGAVGKLGELCVNYHIPIVTSRGGIDIIESDNPMFVGRPGAYGDRASHFAIQQCDLLLILGSSLSVSTIGYYPSKLAEKAIKIMVDIDELELGKQDIPIEYKIKEELGTFFSIILNDLNGKYPVERSAWIKHCQKMKKEYPNVLPYYEKEIPINEYWFTQCLSNNTGNNANIIVDTGSVCNIVSQSWNIKEGQRYLISGGLSCMGFWATAIGVCQEHKEIIAITGDGSAQMNIQELATLKYHHLPIKLFIYNNNGYMLIRHNQHNYMRDRFLGVGPDSGLQTPDFCKVAEAYDVKAVRIKSGDNLDLKIKEVLAYEGPVVCEVIVQEFAPIQPRIASKVMEDGSLKAADFDDLYPFL